MGKLIRYCYFALCISLMLTVPVSAYIDPSVMTYAIQIVAGIAVAVGAMISVMWRKAKRMMRDKFGIDENAGKEVEENIVVYFDWEN